MRRCKFAMGLFGLLAAGPATAGAQSAPAVEVRAFRFYRAESRQTQVQAFVDVPYELLESSAPGPDGQLSYGVVVELTDQAGQQITQASWPGRARADLRIKGASKLEILDFTLAPGKYRVSVTVTDSVSGRRFSSSTEVEGWSEAPRASDLMLSPGMRLATGEDSMPRLGEIRRGNTMVTPATRLRLTPVRSKAFYLVEAYSPTPDSGSMIVRVLDSAGNSVVSSRPTKVRIAAGGSVLKGQLDLAGLPAGGYRFSVAIEVAGQREELTDQLVMAGFEETMQREEARLASLKETDEGYFGTMNGEQLDEAAEPLVYLTTSDSLSVFNRNLSVNAKRQFLIRFWQARDPSPGTERNENRVRFYALIATANRQYQEGGGSKTPGWKTDRGRVFVKYGEPLERLDRRSATGNAPPYEVWRYQRGKELYFIFADRTGFGGYKLMATNDLKETQRPGYREILGREALQDISRWLGIDLFRDESGRGLTPDS